MADRIDPADVERSEGKRPHGDAGAGLRAHIEERRLPPDQIVRQRPPRDIQQAPAPPTPVRFNDPYLPQSDNPAARFAADLAGAHRAQTSGLSVDPDGLQTFVGPVRGLIERTVLHMVFDATGQLEGAYPAEQATHARGRAKAIGGFMLPAEAEDYRR